MDIKTIILIIIIIFLGISLIGAVSQKMDEIKSLVNKENFLPDTELRKWEAPYPQPSTPEGLVFNPEVSYGATLPQINKELPPYDLKEYTPYNEKPNIEIQTYINPWFPKKMTVKPKQNYPNPDEMDETTKNAFKFGYPPGMTLQDYANWLFLWEHQSDALTLDHLTNFQKLKNNVDLQFREGICPPSSRQMIPLSPEEYFQKLYNKDNKPNIATPLNMSEILGFNYGQYDDFMNNFNQFGTSSTIPNPDLWKKFSAEVADKTIRPVWLKKDIKPH